MVELPPELLWNQDDLRKIGGEALTLLHTLRSRRLSRRHHRKLDSESAGA